ncbi:LacI family transcriptional regulator [bacterium]|nr:MAG: LacI family transcriptional regulator [bacterium]
MSHYDGYNAVLKAAGLKSETIICEQWDGATVRQTVRDYIEKHGHPDGIYCHHDELTIATYRALRDLKLDIPRDVALIGCEGNEFLEYFDPSLSTVALPIAEMCQTAWKLLQQRLADPERAPQGITLPYEFLARESST